jgi:hypothetical protein
MSRWAWVSFIVLAAGVGRADDRPLHQRIDTIVEAAAVGPLAATCSDADFVRRVTLDLTGVIPGADAVRRFLADPRSDKRERLVDELLASPGFIRALTLWIDGMLMDKRRDQAWLALLYESLAAGRPLDQICRDVVLADGADEKQRPAARFFIEREAEPNRMTRDIGRIMFGMDLQCAQCHDHPVIDGYRQADYYGLFAFVQRTSVFKDAKNKLSLLAEKADGEAEYTSVFTKEEGKGVRPQLPDGAMLATEPVFAKGQEYVTPPAKDVRGVPRFSRRAALAERLAGSGEFRRNLANRLWALMLGRGLVHPVDFHHEDNPPVHPELLAVLAAELQAAAFQPRPILRAIALSRTYQRSIDPPRPEQVTAAALPDTLTALEAERARLAAAVEPAERGAAQAVERHEAAIRRFSAAARELQPLEAAVAAATAAAAAVGERIKAAEAAVVARKSAAAAVALAAAKGGEAVAAVPDDKVLAAAAAIVAERSKEAATAVEAAVKQAAASVAEQATSAQALKAAREALAAATQKLDPPSAAAVSGLEAAAVAARAAAVDAAYAVAAVDRRIATAKALQEFAAAADPAAREAAWAAVLERWTVAGQLAPLRPLTAEQFCLSAIEATGLMGVQVAAAAAAVDKEPPARLKATAEATKAAVRAGCIELQLVKQLESTLADFSRLYGGQEQGDFQASVNQALFFANAPTVNGWLQPTASSLVARVLPQADPAAVADEIYVAVLSRPATDEEKREVADVLAARAADKAKAVGEIAWGLLSSNEFRFNH